MLYRGDEILPSYMWIVKNHCKNPYEPISIMECQQGFERCSPVVFSRSLCLSDFLKEKTEDLPVNLAKETAWQFCVCPF